MSDYQEGYNDGLAGVGLQLRHGERCERTSIGDTGASMDAYAAGFLVGSLDRKAMLAPEPVARLADSLMNATAGDVMQPVNAAVWADGMGDGDA